MKPFKNIAILAGGTSSRFWPLSDKNLLVFNGLSLLEYQLKKIVKHAENVYLVVNVENQKTITDVAHKIDIHIKIIVQKGNGQDKAVKALQGSVSGPVLIVNSNDLFDETLLDELTSKINTVSCDAMLVAKQMDAYFPGGYIKHSGDTVTGIVEKPKPQDIPSHFVKLVVDYIKDIDEFLSILETNKIGGDDGYEKALDIYVKKGKKIIFLKYDNEWVTLKYPWQVLSVTNFFLSKLAKKTAKNVIIHKTAIIEGDVYLDDGVVISEFTKIVGPTYIGKNTVIGTHSMVRESMIGDNCLIGAYSEVTRSYLGSAVSLHRNYVGDSVFENNILVGGEAVFANFRFDEKNVGSYVKGEMIDTGRAKLGAIIGSNVKIGVNASIMPGVKIGSGLSIAPHQLIKRDCQ